MYNDIFMIEDLKSPSTVQTLLITSQRKQTNSNVKESWIVLKKKYFRKKALSSPRKNISVQLHCHCITFCMSAIHVNNTEVFLQSHLPSTACHKMSPNQIKASSLFPLLLCSLHSPSQPCCMQGAFPRMHWAKSTALRRSREKDPVPSSQNCCSPA